MSYLNYWVYIYQYLITFKRIFPKFEILTKFSKCSKISQVLAYQNRNDFLHILIFLFNFQNINDLQIYIEQ